MVKWVKKFPGAKNISTLRKSPPVYVCEVYLTITVCRVPNLWLRPAANNTHVYGNGCIQWYVNTSLHFGGHCLCRLKTLDRIGHRPMFQKKHRPLDRQAKLTSVDPYLKCIYCIVRMFNKINDGWTLTSKRHSRKGFA